MPSVVSTPPAQPHAERSRDHPPREREDQERSCRPGRPRPRSSRGERGSLAGGQQHRRLEEVRVAHCYPASRSSRSVKPSGPSTTRSASLRSPLVPRSSARPHARDAPAAAPEQLAQLAKGVQVGRVVAARRAPVSIPARPASAASTAVPLSAATGGRISSTMRPQCGARPCCLGLRGDPLERCMRRALVGCAAPVEGPDRVLVLEPHAERGSSSPYAAVGERSARARPSCSTAPVDLGFGCALGASTSSP